MEKNIGRWPQDFKHITACYKDGDMTEIWGKGCGLPWKVAKGYAGDRNANPLLWNLNTMEGRTTIAGAFNTSTDDVLGDGIFLPYTAFYIDRIYATETDLSQSDSPIDEHVWRCKPRIYFKEPSIEEVRAGTAALSWYQRLLNAARMCNKTELWIHPTDAKLCGLR